MRYNVALISDKDWATACTKEARKLCEGYAQGYLLGPGALPHITICQFETDDANSPSQVWELLQEQPISFLDIHPHHLYFWHGTKEFVDKVWIGLAIAAPQSLYETQKHVYAMLLQKVQPLTEPSKYFPHITWAVCPESNLPPVNGNFHHLVKQQPKFSLSIGLSDEVGQYLQVLHD